MLCVIFITSQYTTQADAVMRSIFDAIASTLINRRPLPMYQAGLSADVVCVAGNVDAVSRIELFPISGLTYQQPVC